MPIRKHNMSRTSEYGAWKTMRARCLNPRCRSYGRYGGRGITVCERWLGPDGFKNFFTDMGQKPSPTHSLDRYPDPFGPYSPENCRWATPTEQVENWRTGNIMITMDGETHYLGEWIRRLNLHSASDAIYARVYRGMSGIEALTKPLKYRRTKTHYQGL